MHIDRADLVVPSQVLATSSPATWLRGARVKHWAHFLFLPAAGWDSSQDFAVAGVAMGRGVLIAASVLAFGYLLNGIADRRMDRDVRKNPFAHSSISPSHVHALVALATLAIGLSCFSPKVVLIATLTNLLSGIAYSVGPRLKQYPILGTLTNATNFAPLLWVGIASEAAIPHMVGLTAAFTCLLLQNQLLHEATDRHDDINGGLRTSVIALGPHFAAAGAASLGLALALVLHLSFRIHWLTWPSILLFVITFPIALATRGARSAVMARYRLAHRLCCVVTGAILFACIHLGEPSLSLTVVQSSQH